MAFSVVLTDDVLRDLDDICNYIAEHDSDRDSAYVLDRIEKALCEVLGEKKTVTRDLGGVLGVATDEGAINGSGAAPLAATPPRAGRTLPALRQSARD